MPKLHAPGPQMGVGRDSRESAVREIEFQSLQRLRIAVLASVVGFVASGLLQQVFVQLGWEKHSGWPVHLPLASSALCMTFYVLMGRSRLSLSSRLRIGQFYLILLSLLLGLAEGLHGWDANSDEHGISRVCLVVVLVPVLVPTGVLSALLCALAVASMLPLSRFVLVMAGHPWPDVAELATLLSGDMIALGAAVLPALTISYLNQQTLNSYDLGNYRLHRVIGEGGMGQVWTATHRHLKRPVAIKFLSISDDDSKEVLSRRFEQEVEVLANLKSPHTIRIFDFGRDGQGRLYYVMEFLNGLDFERLIQDYGAQPPGRVIELLLQACDSLEEAHLQGLVHRDVKPANLFLTYRPYRGDFLTILDFGLVKRLGVPCAGISHPDIVLGTPDYLAPESFQGGVAVDARADIYCLGCVAFWLLTGQPVFPREGSLESIQAHCATEAVRPSWRTSQDIPRALDDLVLQCLQKSPDDRPPSIKALAEKLGHIERGDWDIEKSSQWWKRFTESRSVN